MPAPPPTARLLRAVAAERDELDRHRARMTEEADELRRALARIERGLVDIDERRALLDRLTAEPDTHATVARRAAPRTSGNGRARSNAGVRGDSDVRGHADVRGDAEVRSDAEVRGDSGVRGDAGVRSDVGDDDALLRGPEIRAAAVRVLLERGGEAMHYRDWYALVEARGLEVAGKDPLAVFLTQLGRSPAVRRGVEAGVYELDRHAGARHRTKLEGLQRELRELTMDPGGDLQAIRARRQQLSVEIGRVERSLEEIARVLGPAPPLAAAG
jgi:hypothetical protein